jgi:hypothetical protein
VRVLVACEYSGTVRDAFLRRGHDAMSCDLLPTETPGPHHIGDALELLQPGRWDLVIAHPPCTYLSRAGARWLYQGGVINEDRLRRGQEAAAFFLALLNAPAPRVAVENPTPLRVFRLPPPSHHVQPWEYGHPYSKKTLLWLRGLPPLMPTVSPEENVVPLLPSNTGAGRRAGQSHHITSISAHDSARTFPGIAEAMAEQWGTLLPARAA